jgi:hypothetical protein
MREPNQKFIQLSSYSTPKTTEHRCPPLAASPLPQTFVVIFWHLYLMEVVDVFPPPHMIYLLRNSVANTQYMFIILVIVPVLTVDVPDVVENIVGCAVLVVLEDGQHVGCL